MPPMAIDKQRALTHLLDLLAIEGLSGREANVAAAVRAKLMAAGCRPEWIRHDNAHQRLEGFEIGNLIVTLPGSGGGNDGPRRLFMGHLDTVPLCRGARWCDAATGSPAPARPRSEATIEPRARRW